MIFNQTTRPKDWGTNSFKDFHNGLIDQTRNVKQKFLHSTDKATSMRISNCEIPNVKYHSETWDCKHMDKFLQDQNWAKTPSMGTRNSNYYSKSTKSANNLQKKGPPTADSTKQSFFFHTVSRFKPNEDNFRKTAHSNDYSSHNFTVYERKTNAEKAAQYFKKEFQEGAKDFETQKLEFTDQPVRLASPEEKRRELLDTKAQQVKFNKWKTHHMDLTKKMRVHKSEFGSGILQVDNPYNWESQLYKEEAENIKNRQIHSQQINERFKKQIEERTKTNNAIEFFNSKNLSKQQAPTFNYQYDKMAPHWNNKKRISHTSGSYSCSSQEKLFGGPIQGKYNMKRAEYLKSQDLKGRQMDFFGYRTSHLQDFEKAHERRAELDKKEYYQTQLQRHQQQLQQQLQQQKQIQPDNGSQINQQQ